MLMWGWATGHAVSPLRGRCVVDAGGRIALPLRLLIAALMLMSSMPPVVHEEMHEWARCQEQPRQVRDHVCAMLGDDEEATDDGEHHEYLLHPSADQVFAD